MTKYRQINVNAPDLFFPNQKPDFTSVIGAVQKALSAGETPFIRPTPWFPAHFTASGQPTYAQFERGCGNLRARGVLRIKIVGPTGTPFPQPALDRDIDRARVVTFYAIPGQTITIQDPGVLRRSPVGFFVGIPGGQSTKHGTLRDMEGRGTTDRPRVSFGGGFTYTANADAPVGSEEEVVFLLIDTSGGGFKQPYDLIPYFDVETHPEYCGFASVPTLKGVTLLSYGQALAAALSPYQSHIAFWCAPVNEPEYRVFWPRRLREEENAPNLQALHDEVIWPFIAGMKGIGSTTLPRFVEGGPDTGSPDVMRWWLNLPRHGRELVTFHAYAWAGEKFPDAIAYKLDNWLKPELDAVGWHGSVFITELGDMTGTDATNSVGVSSMTPEKWQAVLPILKARPWITAAYNGSTDLVEEI